jgi:RimJ/RimL family protein N-acetyltransferase
VPGITEEDLERYSKDYSIPRLQMPFSVKSNDRTIGIIGLSNLIWSNKRANLNIFLDKELGDDIVKQLSSHIIDDYINYVHSSNVHNITLSIKGSDNNMLDLINNTNMNYYGELPFSVVNGDNIESNFMFQHIPNMKKQNGIYIPDNNSVSKSLLETDKKELSEKIELGNGFKFVSPKCFEKENIDFNNVLKGHIEAMQERDRFTIPLGEDKYILQKGNENYGMTKAFMNYSYVILDDKNNYAGYVNVLRSSADGKNVDIEIGIDPKIQHMGLGTVAINRFYDELFSIGVASVTSAVFEFNNPSIKLHEKVAELNGIRLESYYINGKLWDMNFYSKINNIIDENNNKKHI